MDKQQLIKKNQGGSYSNIYPKTFIDAIKDKESGISLSDILNGFNMYFLSYTGSSESTRLLVNKLLRRQGLWITYVKYDKTVVTEWYAGEDISDTAWKNNSNWRIGSNSLVGDITISSNGNWVINGVDSGLPARGEKGDSPVLRVNDTHTYIEYSTDGKVWNKLLELNLITPKVSVGTTTTTTEGSKAKVVNSGDNFNVVLDFSIPKGDTGNGVIVKGFYPDLATLKEKITTPSIGDTYCVGTSDPFTMYVWANVYDSGSQTSTPSWQSLGEINRYATIIIQDLGDSETSVMSQKAVTTEINKLDAKIVSIDLTNYYKKTETYSKTECDDKFATKDSVSTEITKQELVEVPKISDIKDVVFTKAGKPVDDASKYSISIDIDTNKITVITK